MVNKWFLPLVVSASAGGALVYFADNEYKIYSIVNEKGNDTSDSGIYKKDWNILRKRNSSAFGLDKDRNTAGIAWKASVEGNVYRDETYYVFKDYSWLNGVQIEGGKKTTFTGGEKLKSYVDGVGLKIEKIGDKWEYENDAWKRTRNIEVKRVLMKDGYQFDASKGTCFLKATEKDAQSNSNLYLLIGFMKTNKADKMSKPDYTEFAEGQESFCENYAGNKYGIGNSKISISLDIVDGQITGNEYPVLAVIEDNKKLISPIYWNTKEGVSVNPVVLGLAVKGKQQSNIDENGWEILTKHRAIQEIQKKIHSGEIVERHSKNSTVGFELKQKSDSKLKGETTERWTAKAEISFK